MSTTPDSTTLLRETLLFDWKQWKPAVAWRSAPALAIALGVGIAVGHPAGGLVAAAGAFTTGLGSLQRIRGSCLIPMLLAAVGMTLSTFVGMILGHQSLLMVFAAGGWAATYALLTAMKGGTSWVGLQCAVFLLVASAFHTSPRGALTRCSLILSGGLLQTGIAWIWLRVQRGRTPAEHPKEDDDWRLDLGGLRCLSLKNPTCVFGLRLALVVMAAAEFYRHTGFLSGYWIPMTALLVTRQDFYQTLTRGVLRVAGTLVGAGIAGVIAAHLRPSPMILAALIVFFAWWAFSLLQVNYALFTMCLTAYIVFLLSLSGLPPATVVHRRAAYTLLGGALALLAYLDIFARTGRHLRQEKQRTEMSKAA
ncbi:MAG TPA: FUSC family protein [Acidobacteriaceae bacterium]|nr:FUSC family protein [Acidobacteriaceae bacterium]